jgi:hypothetical protein
MVTTAIHKEKTCRPRLQMQWLANQAANANSQLHNLELGLTTKLQQVKKTLHKASKIALNIKVFNHENQPSPWLGTLLWPWLGTLALAGQLPHQKPSLGNHCEPAWGPLLLSSFDNAFQFPSVGTPHPIFHLYREKLASQLILCRVCHGTHILMSFVHYQQNEPSIHFLYR